MYYLTYILQIANLVLFIEAFFKGIFMEFMSLIIISLLQLLILGFFNYKVAKFKKRNIYFALTFTAIPGLGFYYFLYALASSVLILLEDKK